MSMRCHACMTPPESQHCSRSWCVIILILQMRKMRLTRSGSCSGVRPGCVTLDPGTGAPRARGGGEVSTASCTVLQGLMSDHRL